MKHFEIGVELKNALCYLFMKYENSNREIKI